MIFHPECCPDPTNCEHFETEGVPVEPGCQQAVLNEILETGLCTACGEPIIKETVALVIFKDRSVQETSPGRKYSGPKNEEISDEIDYLNPKVAVQEIEPVRPYYGLKANCQYCDYEKRNKKRNKKN
jgi:hypothetical protein